MTRLQDNIILLTDSYKLSHYRQYPPGTQYVYSYFESRAGAKYDFTLFFGLQYFIKRYLQGRVVTREKIDQAKLLADMHMMKIPGAFNQAGWEYILERHNGILPIRIKAVAEGTKVPTGNVLMTIENTDPACYWLTNYLETLLVQVWYPSTVATISHVVKNLISTGLDISGNPNLLPFKLHDFGFRGSTSVESAGLGGLAHLVNFRGTDTIAALGCGIDYYDSGVCAFSIPASEHSTITSWGKKGEIDAFRNMLEQYPTGLVACVSDSFDIYNACKNLWGDKLRDLVMDRDGTLVVRPDSGDIVPMVLSVLKILETAFGSYVNSKGYKVLNDKVRVIQGDGCTPDTISDVITNMISERWSVDNIAFGMGGGLLQKLDRDTQRFAFKCSAICIDDVWKDVYKAPVSDPTKNSKRGRLRLVTPLETPAAGYMTIREEEFDSTKQISHLFTVFNNGELIRNVTFDNVKARVG